MIDWVWQLHCVRYNVIVGKQSAFFWYTPWVHNCIGGTCVPSMV